MHIWTIENWKKYYVDKSVRTGLRFDNDVDPEVHRACKNFVKWLRKEYYFPFRVVVYVKSSVRIRASDGELVCGIFVPMENRLDEPYINILTGDYIDIKKKWGRDNSLASILAVIAHELTHYFQWINDLKLTPRGEERQATMYSKYIIDEYHDTREHP